MVAGVDGLTESFEEGAKADAYEMALLSAQTTMSALIAMVDSQMASLVSKLATSESTPTSLLWYVETIRCLILGRTVKHSYE